MDYLGKRWHEMREQRLKPSIVSFDKDFQERSLEDFSNHSKQNSYEYGRKVIGIIKSILGKDKDVLEFGSSPGVLTVSLSKSVKNLTCIERSKKSILHLRKNLKEANRSNVNIVNGDWGHAVRLGKFNISLCSHFLWMVDDLEEFLRIMENRSRDYCVIVQPCKRDSLVGEIYERLTGQSYNGQFEPDVDQFAYFILRQWGRLLNVEYFSYSLDLSLEKGIRYVAGFVGRFMEVNADVAKAIEKLLKKSDIPGI